MKFIFPKDVRGYLSPGEGRLLFELAQMKPNLGSVVELGCYLGRSTICLAQGSKVVKGNKVFAVDKFVGGESIGKESYFYPESDFWAQFKQNVKRHHLEDWIVGIRGDTVEVAKKWQKPIRLLFIDASHEYEAVLRDFRAWEKHIVPHGLIAFHDSLAWSGVNKVICQIIKSSDFKDFRTFGGSESSGITFGVKKTNDESITKLKRHQASLRFKLISLPKLPSRIRQTVNKRGETDVVFRTFDSLANFGKRLTGRR